MEGVYPTEVQKYSLLKGLFSSKKNFSQKASHRIFRYIYAWNIKI